MYKTYSELIKLPTFEERFAYLKLDNFDEDHYTRHRYLNQKFYKSYEWKRIRREVIIRDKGCDLACEGREICGRVIIHHINPIGITDMLDVTEMLLNPEYLICVSKPTHEAIHNASDSLLQKPYEERRPNDTCPWRK
jgi:hypothetical protein